MVLKQAAKDSFGRDDTGAPFNMGLATLQRVNDLLIQYSAVSVAGFDKITCATIKHKLCRQIHLMSIPLIYDDKDKKELKSKVNKLKEQFFKIN
jgi:hypothetical protein